LIDHIPEDLQIKIVRNLLNKGNWLFSYVTSNTTSDIAFIEDNMKPMQLRKIAKWCVEEADRRDYRNPNRKSKENSQKRPRHLWKGGVNRYEQNERTRT